MSKYSVRKPITVLMAILMIIVLGVFGLTQMSMGLFPNMELPYMVVVTPYVGADAETVYDEVTSKIESKLSSISNYNGMISTSSEHYSMVMVEFLEGTNMDKVMVEIREELNNIDFADGIGNSTLMQISPDMLPVMSISMSVEYEGLTDEEELIRTTEFINSECMDKFNAIPGVAEVSLTGAAQAVLQINLDPVKLAGYGYSNSQILELIQEQNIEQLTGFALDSGEIRLLYLGESISTLEEVKELPIPLTVNGENKVFKLSELCVENGIKFINENNESYSKVNGKQTVSISFQMQSDAEITDVTEAIHETLDEIVDEYDNVNYTVILDQGDYIELAVGSVLENLISGAILAILILFLFLKDYRPTLLVGISIPISVIGAFMAMYFAGVNLNMLSMGGLALAIGMLVDNSIVVIENIYRLIGEGKSKKEAAIEGAKGVASAIVSSTLTTIVVFFPIILLGGMIADIFIDMTLTITFSLLASLFIALTMIPSFGNLILKDKDSNKEKKVKKEGKFFKKLTSGYEKTVRYTIKHRVITLVATIVLLFVSIIASSAKGFIMLPATDDNAISISIDINTDAGFSDTSEYVDDLCLEIREVSDEITSVGASFGKSSGVMAMLSTSSSNTISINVTLDREHKTSTKQMMSEIENTINEFNNNHLSDYNNIQILEKSFSASNSSMAIMASGISIQVKGQDIEDIAKVTDDITNIVKNVEGVNKAGSNIVKATENIKVVVDKNYAASLGYTQKEVLDSMNLLFANSSISAVSNPTTATVIIDGNEYELNVPSDSMQAGVSLNDLLPLFGSHEQFLKNIMVFDGEVMNAINAYQASGNTIYTMDIPLVDPSSPTGFYLNFQVHPLLIYKDGAISMTSTEELMANAQYLLVRQGHLLFNTSSEGSIASAKKITGHGSIYSDGKYKTFTVSATVDSDKNITKVSSDVTKEVEKYLDSDEFAKYKKSVKVVFAGENEEIMDVMSDLLIAALVAILLVYMIMAIQFQSLKYPLVVLGTIPLAFTGGLFAILLCGMNISIVVMMGLIILVGVVVNNGIVLIDYINQLREEGTPVIEACVQAGKTRLRPILMTALTTILGLSTMALGLSNGSELLQPLAIAAIGGLLYSTILTLGVVPAIYVLVNKKAIKKEQTKALETENKE